MLPGVSYGPTVCSSVSGLQAAVYGSRVPVRAPRSHTAIRLSRSVQNQADGNEQRGVGDGLEARNRRAKGRGNRFDSRPSVVLQVRDGDGQEVRYLPQSQDSKRASASVVISFATAVYPISGGIAPGIAPTGRARVERCLSGV